MSQISRRNFLKNLGIASLTLPLLKKVPLPQVEPEPEPEPEIEEIEQEIADISPHFITGDFSSCFVAPCLPEGWAYGSWKPFDYPNYTRY